MATTFNAGDLVWVPGIVVFPKSDDAPAYPLAVGVVFPGVVREDYRDGQTRVDIGPPVSQEINIDSATLEPRDPGEWARWAKNWDGLEAKQSGARDADS